MSAILAALTCLLINMIITMTGGVNVSKLSGLYEGSSEWLQNSKLSQLTEL